MSKIMVTCLVGICLAVGLAGASTPYEPPEGGDKWQYSTVLLKGTEVDKDAKGKAILACNLAETQHRIQLSSEKTVPRGVYSVWLVKFGKVEEGTSAEPKKTKKMVQELRIDNPKKPLKADKNGKLAFASNLESCPHGKYHEVQIRYHADGRSDRVKNAKTALSGKIP